ncbi:Beta-glucosidase 17 [Linum perenne]
MMRSYFLIVLLLVQLAAAVAGARDAGPKPTKLLPFTRASFPDGFIFGTGTAAYQSEGAASGDGKGPSIWDTFVKQHPEKIMDRSNGDLADDFYNKYREDIKLVKKIGLDSFRFSISWSRILPKGTISGGVNQLGLKFYNNLIDEILAHGMKPFVTLWHFDLPQALEDEYGGFLSPKIMKDYVAYADLCFKTFGDRVKLWATLNEANGYAVNAYNTGSFPPARCSSSATEPYIVGHHLLLCHGWAVKLYREKYQKVQKGEIGITIVTNWYIPKYNTASSRMAASRAVDFFFGWFANPITYGEYPKSMLRLVGKRLPRFTEEEKKMMKGSYDFLAVNYYTTQYAEEAPPLRNAGKAALQLSYASDRRLVLTSDKNGVPIGTPTGLNWLFIYPKGFKEFLLYVKNTYDNPTIYITENGMADKKEIPKEVAIKDALRIRYHSLHLQTLLEAMKEGVKVKGYYVWCFLDDFEWDAGLSIRFGITYVDFAHNLKRYLKYSAYWFKMMLLTK